MAAGRRRNPQILKPDEAQNADRPPELAPDEQVARQHARSERFIREKQRLVFIVNGVPALCFIYVFLTQPSFRPMIAPLALLFLMFVWLPLYLLGDMRHARLSGLPKKLVFQTRENRSRWSRQDIRWQAVKSLTILRFQNGEIRSLQVEHGSERDAVVGFERMEELAAALRDVLDKSDVNTATLKLDHSSIWVQLAVMSAVGLLMLEILSWQFLGPVAGKVIFYVLLLAQMTRPFQRAVSRFLME